MNLIVCIDDNNGMCFNGRRQSRDKILINRIENMVGDKKIWMHPSSESLFGISVYADEDFLNRAGSDDFCFTENELPSEDKIKKIIIYRWNRSYPYDTEFNLDLSKWKLEKLTDFVGFSHDKITEEVYINE